MTTKQDNWLDRLAALRDAMPQSDEPESAPAPEPEAAPQIQKDRLLITYERKGRAGKSATIVSGFTMADDDVAALASEMKRRLGTGGSARGGEILIQGDRRDDVRAFLLEKKFKVGKS
ncbi:MAG: translation initiation factor [Muribaculaceae bacterium]|nr:translation initiation factor [Muribaculaceae bacterium]